MFSAPRNKVLLITVILIAVVFLLASVRFFAPSFFSKSPQPSSDPTGDLGIEDFLKSYWQKPIPLQGTPPANYSKLEASLRPEACGSCHAQQYTDWKESFHAQAMGPGPWGQIVDLAKNSPDEAAHCLTCHAPLSEQLPTIVKTGATGDSVRENNPHFDPELQLQGIVCAACHVRQNQRFGPPKADAGKATTYPADMPNHGGVQRTPYFERAEFCRDCHQFDPENSLLVNGKPLQDTYREWQNSMWAKGGTACQDCHMSNRRHLWKGIHDQDWVKGGVRIETKVSDTQTTKAPGPVTIIIEVVNSAVGHKFPTYITPKVFVRSALIDDSNRILPGTQQEQIIGWDARFENGDWKEYFDTRISPGEKFEAKFSWKSSRGAKKVRTWVEVHPDHFYHVHFYPAYLGDPAISPQGRKLIEKALRDSSRTFLIYDQIHVLNQSR